MKNLLNTALSAALLAAGSQAFAADFILVNADPAGVGFNDPTPVAPVGGNNGATLGEQRLNVYYRAFQLWGQVLESTQPIVVQATWAPLSCTATGGVLGSAGTTYIFNNFPNAPLANHWYHSALTDKLSGTDQVPGQADIRTFFNVNLGTPGCLQTSSWYYGLDNNEAPNQIDFLSVLMHEVAHGLGFSNFINEGTGAMQSGLPDVYAANTLDNITGLQWNNPAMTNALRANSGKSVDKMVWNGAAVVSDAPNVLAAYTGVRFTAPAGAAGDYDLAFATFGPAPVVGSFGGTAVYTDDGVGAVNDACEPIVNAAAIAGKYAIADRGTCTFTVKAKNAQDAGAIGVIIANNASGLPGMGGSDPSITIPSIGVPQSVAQPIKDAGGVAEFSLFSDPSRRVGADLAGNPRLYAPSVYASGSSGSHFDVSASPNLLMEPSINPDLRSATNVDLTAAQFADIGWDIGNFDVAGCDAGVPAVLGNGDVLLAPILQCADNAKNKGQFQACTTQYLNQLKDAGVISGAVKGQLSACAARLK